jgi:hypothetical protein
VLTFGGVPASVSAAIAPAAVEPVAHAAADEAPATAAHASSTHASATHAAAMHASAPHAHPAATVAMRATNSRVLKSAAHSSRSRKHKRVAAR